MRKPFVLFAITVTMVLLLSTACSSANLYKKDQEVLADWLGVDLSEYRLSDFPVSYYETLIQPGMSLQEVHAIITGYTKVFSCNEYKEVYYYFSVEDSKAFRFEVFYDYAGETSTFRKFREEDRNSRYIRTEGCSEGLLHK